jgi:hypothetical protein
MPQKNNAPQHIAAPFLTTVMQIEPQWIDYNGHLNMAYYNVLFDRGIDQMWLELGIGPDYMKTRIDFHRRSACTIPARGASGRSGAGVGLSDRSGRQAHPHLRGATPRD